MLINEHIARLEDVMVAKMKIVFFWNVMPYSLVDRYQCLEGTQKLHLLVKVLNYPKNVGFEVPTAVVIRNYISWGEILCSSVKVY
jgi:hypothetical protein